MAQPAQLQQPSAKKDEDYIVFERMGFRVRVRIDADLKNEISPAGMEKKLNLMRWLVPLFLIEAKKHTGMTPSKEELRIRIMRGGGGQYNDQNDWGEIRLQTDPQMPDATVLSILTHEMVHWLADLPGSGEWWRSDMGVADFRRMSSILERAAQDRSDAAAQKEFEQINPQYKKWEQTVFRQDVLMEGTTDMLTIRMMDWMLQDDTPGAPSAGELRASTRERYSAEKVHAGLLMIVVGEDLFIRSFLAGDVGPIAAAFERKYGIGHEQFNAVSSDMPHLISFLINCEGAGRLREWEAELKEKWGITDELGHQIDALEHMQAVYHKAAGWSAEELGERVEKFKAVVRRAEKNGHHAAEFIRTLDDREQEALMGVSMRLGVEAGIPADDWTTQEGFMRYFAQAMLPETILISFKATDYSKQQNYRYVFPPPGLDEYGTGIVRVAEKYGLNNPYLGKKGKEEE